MEVYDAPEMCFSLTLASLCLILQAKQYRMFHDDSMRSFFRRLSFTPDGSFLLAPGTLTHAPKLGRILVKWLK